MNPAKAKQRQDRLREQRYPAATSDRDALRMCREALHVYMTAQTSFLQRVAHEDAVVVLRRVDEWLSAVQEPTTPV